MKRSELDKVVFAYILDAIDGEGYGKTLNTDKEKLQFLADTFKGEYCYPENLRYYGNHYNTFKKWLMGLPSAFNVDFENYRIIQLAKKWECIPQDADDKQEDKIIDNWFNWITNKTFQLMKRHKVTPF